MPKASDFFNRTTINAEDVGSKRVIAKIVSVEPMTLRDDTEKLALTLDKFNNRRLALNSTNLSEMIELFGDDFSKWKGKSIALITVPVKFQNKMTRGVRIEAAK